MTKFQKKLWLGLLVMALVTPLGILLPEKFGASDAWGEWGIEIVEKMLGYVPGGMRRLADIWKAPVPDYGGESRSPLAAYMLSALLGIGITGGVAYLISYIVARRNRRPDGEEK